MKVRISRANDDSNSMLSSSSMESSSSSIEPSCTVAGSNLGDEDSNSIEPSHSAAGSYLGVCDSMSMLSSQGDAETDLDMELQKLMEQLAIMIERLQNVFNESAEIKVKHKEYEKVQRELEFKVSYATCLDKLQENMKSIPLRLGTYEEAINTCEKELVELDRANAMETSIKKELNRAASLLEGKAEIETPVSKKTEMQSLMVELEDILKVSSDKDMQDLLLRKTELAENIKGIMDGLMENGLKNKDEVDLLQKEVERSEEKIAFLEERVAELESSLEDKEQFVAKLETKQKQLDDQKSEAYKGIKDITERNEQKIKDLKEENRQHLLQEQEKYATLIRNMQEEHAKKETSTQLQVETEIRERLNTLWPEHKAQLIKSVRREYEHEIKRLQIELDIEKAKRLRSNDLLSTSPRHPSSPGPDSKRSSTMKLILFALLISLLFGAAMAVFNGNKNCIICSATAGYLRGVSVSIYLLLGNALFIPIWVLVDILWQVTPIQVPNFIEYIIQLAFGLVSFYLSSACEECKDALSFLVVTCVSFSVIIFLKLFLVLEGFGVVNTLFALGLASISKFGPPDVWFYLILFYSPCFLSFKLLVDKYPAAIEKARAFFNAYRRHERIA